VSTVDLTVLQLFIGHALLPQADEQIFIELHKESKAIYIRLLEGLHIKLTYNSKPHHT